MPYQLPPDLDYRVQSYRGAGGYKSDDEVLRTALDALEEREQEKLRRWQEGNRIAIEQSEQGLSKPLDDEAVIARLRTRLLSAKMAIRRARFSGRATSSLRK